MDRYLEALQQCQTEGTYRTIPELSLRGKEVELAGQWYLNLNSNDYLGLLDIPLWQRFLEEQGNDFLPSSASSRLLTGNDRPFSHFEHYLSGLYRSESALLWDSGYHANSGIIPVLALPNTLFIADKLVHASIIDGLRLAGAPFQRYRHNDLEHLRKLLSRYAHDYQTIWVVTESLFSMDGDFAPLQDIAALKEEYPHLHLYVDEAHAVGVYGEGGLGYASQLGLLPKVDLLVGTLGKALGSVGAYSIQSDTLRHLLVSRARPLIFSTALPPIQVAWSQYVFEQVAQMDSRRAHLRALIQQLNQQLDTHFESQIIPLIVPGEEQVQRAAELFLSHGLYIRPIRKPTVPAGSERLRISLTAAMSETEVTKIANLCRQI